MRSLRHLSQLGGTTTMGDAVVAAALMARRRSLVDGSAIARYEAELARRLGTAHAVTFGAGRLALYGILRGLGVGPGAEVVVALPTHIVVPNAVRYLGATPVYADCRLSDFNVDPDAVADAIGARTRAVLVQHTFGIPADMERLTAVTAQHGTPLVEDCVHALGATWRGRPVGSIGAAGFFSTEETKVITTTMGGVGVTSQAELGRALRAFRSECSRPDPSLTRKRLAKLVLYHLLTHPNVHRASRYAYELAGERNPLPQPTSPPELEGRRPAHYEERLATALAEIGLRQLRGLERNLAHRRRIASEYAKVLTGLGFRPPAVAADAAPAWVRYPVLVADRGAAQRVLRRLIVPGTWFTSVQEESVDPTINEYRAGSCPRAETAARQLVNLPTHPRVSSADVARIAEAMRGIEPAAPEGAP